MFAAQGAQAHDIPNERVDRSLQIVLEPPSLQAVYEVSQTEWTLYQDLKRLAPEQAGNARIDRIDAYARMIAPLNARGLLASVDGSELSWIIDDVVVDYEDHVLLRFVFHASIPDQGHLRVLDSNYASSYGISRLALRHAPTTRIEGYDGPTELDEVEEIPIFLMSDDEEQQTREVSLDYERSGHSEPLLAAQSGGQSEPQAAPKPVAEGSETDRPEPKRLTRLFWESPDTTRPILLLAAVLLGAAHALQPGHGKSVVVGASIQGDRPIRQGLILASSAAAAHLVLAVLLAVVAMLLLPQEMGRIDGPLTRGVGLVLAILGSWRIGTMLNGLPRHAEAPGASISSAREALVTGLAIGAIPCWDAVLLLAMAWVAGKLLLGVALLVAFSLGASATLLGVALCAGWFRSLTHRVRGSSILERCLGTAGGLLLAGVGVSMFFF
jgi:ABC-type nickel/cobalt efflux system permease component RcnA